MAKHKNKETRRFYSLVKNGREADLDIYGDIAGDSYWGCESDIGIFKLSRQLEELDDIDHINVNINSYGGEVAEGIAIYNALVRHPASITTRCDGMACSIASVIFMAGDERIMYEPSILMIHNASSMAWGTAADLRKAAEDNEKITSMSKAAYMQCINISEQELTELMDAETWITPAEAYNMGFATAVESRADSSDPSQSTRQTLFSMITEARRSRQVAEFADVEAELNAAAAEETEQPAETDETENTEDPPPEEQCEQDTASDEERQEQAWRSFFMAAYN